MVTCKKCQTENRSGAKFCKGCGAPLPVSEKATLPLSEETAMRVVETQAIAQVSSSVVTQKMSSNLRTGTQPLAAPGGFSYRPSGAIFGEAFLYKSLIFSDNHQNHYQVTQLGGAAESQIRVCPKAECGAFFPSQEYGTEKFCTDCGAELVAWTQELLLVEAGSPFPPNLIQVTAKCLAHGSVRAPLNLFWETVAGAPRYCLVSPLVRKLEKQPDLSQALRWGIGLARGLDYLHDNGVWFEGNVNDSLFSLSGDRAVWANFSSCLNHPAGYVSDRTADVRALSMQLFFWLTGKTRFERTASLTPAVGQLFEKALNGQGFASGNELAQALEEALEETLVPQAVDFRFGRSTNVGRVRTLNEDSLLTLELNRTLQSVSQPLGVFVIADGMGGHAAGELASGTIINTIAQKALTDLLPYQLSHGASKDRRAWLQEAVEAANRAVFDLRKSSGTDMGSTLVSAVVEGNVASIAHVGDSRAYLINAAGIRQLTTDHSLVERLVATNQITREEARFHPQRNVIYRTIGDKPKVDVETAVHRLNPGDHLLLCSDGLSGMVEDQLMFQIVMSTVSPQVACDELVDAANAAGGEDNISVIIVKIVQP